MHANICFAFSWFQPDEQRYAAGWVSSVASPLFLGTIRLQLHVEGPPAEADGGAGHADVTEVLDDLPLPPPPPPPEAALRPPPPQPEAVPIRHGLRTTCAGAGNKKHFHPSHACSWQQPEGQSLHRHRAGTWPRPSGGSCTSPGPAPLPGIMHRRSRVLHYFFLVWTAWVGHVACNHLGPSPLVGSKARTRTRKWSS